MFRSNNIAAREVCRVILSAACVIPSAACVILSAACVILSAAKDLGKLGRFFAALRMTDGVPRCISFGTGPMFRTVAHLMVVLAILGMGSAVSLSRAGEPKPEETKPSAAQPETADRLAMEQQQVAEKYNHLIEVLSRMAELSRPLDPRRAALLRKAVDQSGEKLIGVQFETLVDLLKNDQLARAIDNQGDLDRDLSALLALLMSENREKLLASEKARIRKYLERLGTILNQERGIEGRTAGGGEPQGLAEEQAKLAGKTGDLAKDIKANEENGAKPGAGKQGAGKQGAGKQASREQGAGKQGSKEQGSKGQGAGKPGDSKPGTGKPGAGKPGEGKPGEGEPGDSQSGEDQKQDQDNPARKRLEAAQQKMREAEENLKKAQREGAKGKQEEAIQELLQAKAELERILRQLREEEIKRTLEALEARFTKMLQMQRVVYDGTIKLDKVPLPERTHSHEIESGRLGAKEAEIDLEGEKAMLLLKDDGSTAAFPEALTQVRQDIRQVSQRLSEYRVDKTTQGVEEDVIAQLEEMVKALQKAIKEADKRKQANQQQGQPTDPPLVDVLGEIKMIRSLQIRVNIRTNRYSKLIGAGEQAEQADLVDAIRRLAERQERIFKVTRDLEMGKTQ